MSIRLSNCNAHQVLSVCFRKFTAYRGASQHYGSAARITGTVDSRLERLCDDKVAASVIGFVDRMDKIHSAYCYFCFSADSDWERYSLLSNNIRRSYLEKNTELRREKFAYVCMLSILAPYEYRYRILNPAKSMHSWQQLATLLGMNQESFRGAASQVWRGLLDEMADIALKADSEIITFVRKINHLDTKTPVNTKTRVDKNHSKNV